MFASSIKQKHHTCIHDNLGIYLALVLFFSMFIPALFLLAAILGLLYCKKNNLNSFIIQGLLQFVGVIGLLGMYGKAGLVIAGAYFLAIIAINGDKKDDWGVILGASPIYTVIILGFLFLISDELPRTLFAGFPHLNLSSLVGSSPNITHQKTAVYLPFATSILGLSIFLVWKKTRSLLLSLILFVPLLIIAFYFLMILSASNFRPGL